MSLEKDLRETLIKEILDWQNRKEYVFNGFVKPYTRNQLCDMEVEILEIELENIVLKK